MRERYRTLFGSLVITVILCLMPGAVDVGTQSNTNFVPVTDAMLQNPAPEDWLMWRRTLNGWGYSPLDQVTTENVGDLQLVWSRALTEGRQQGTPLAYDGVLYMPNPRDVIQAIDAVSGDLLWEYRREVPEDVGDAGLRTNNRNLAIYDNLIIDTSIDGYVFCLLYTSPSPRDRG